MALLVSRETSPRLRVAVTTADCIGSLLLSPFTALEEGGGGVGSAQGRMVRVRMWAVWLICSVAAGGVAWGWR